MLLKYLGNNSLPPIVSLLFQSCAGLGCVYVMCKHWDIVLCDWGAGLFSSVCDTNIHNCTVFSGCHSSSKGPKRSSHVLAKMQNFFFVYKPCRKNSLNLVHANCYCFGVVSRPKSFLIKLVKRAQTRKSKVGSYQCRWEGLAASKSGCRAGRMWFQTRPGSGTRGHTEKKWCRPAPCCLRSGNRSEGSLGRCRLRPL